MDRGLNSRFVTIFLATVVLSASLWLGNIQNYIQNNPISRVVFNHSEQLPDALVRDSRNNVTYVGTTQDGVDHFQNIFYGQDTSGKNRFAAPVPINPQSGSVVDATKPGA